MASNDSSIGSPEKICTGCKKSLPLDQFGRDKHSRDGLSYKCLECKRRIGKETRTPEKTKQYRKAYVEKHPGIEKEVQRRYRKNNPEKVRATQRKSKTRNPEVIERVCRQRREGYWRNRDSILARQRQKRILEPERFRKNAKNNRARHLDRILEANRKRRALQSGASINDLTRGQWLIIKIIYGFRCVYCGRKMKRLTQDHIHPLILGGNHTASNIVPACQSCNSRKGGRFPQIPVQLHFGFAA